MKFLAKQKIKGEITAPNSKSHFIRLVAGALLCNLESEISYFNLSNDSNSALRIIENLGAEVSITSTKILIKGGLNLRTEKLNCGESGLVFRMFSVIAALSEKSFEISGVGSLLTRPVGKISKELQKLGLNCKTKNDYPPLKVIGKIKNNIIEVDGSESSQFLSGLLFVMPILSNNSVIKVRNLKSKPYIDLTIETLKQFGVEVKNNLYKEFLIQKKQIYKPVKTLVEGDWSGAAFFAVAGAIGGEITIKGLKNNSTQADIKIIEALQKAGAELEFTKNNLVVRKAKLEAFEFDAEHCPDLFPPLAVLAANCSGISKIKGVKRLFTKESNRAYTLKDEFYKLGINIDVKDDTMFVEGGIIKGGNTKSHNDHRIAMALAIMSINSTGEIYVENFEAISKSYITFYKDFKTIIQV